MGLFGGGAPAAPPPPPPPPAAPTIANPAIAETGAQQAALAAQASDQGFAGTLTGSSEGAPTPDKALKSLLGQ